MRKDFWVQKVHFYIGTAFLVSAALLSGTMIVRASEFQTGIFAQYAVSTEYEVVLPENHARTK